jgi:uncharacterized protein (TIGR00369 family)
MDNPARNGKVFMSSTKKLEERLHQIPVFQKFRFEASNLKEGTATLTAPYDPTYDGIFNCFHGGLLMTLADTAACAALLTVVGADAVIATTDMNIRFLAPCRSEATAEAKIIKVGKTLCPVSVEVRDAQNLPVAVAQVTYMRLR